MWETLIMIALGVGLGWLARWGMRKGIGEAQFKPKSDEHNK